MRPPRSAATAAALVAETRPEELALGAASGRPVAAISRAAKPTGMRRPTVPSPRRDQRADAGAFAQRHDEGERAGPEGIGQPLRHGIEDADAIGHGAIGDVDDQRVEARAALGLVDARHGLPAGGVGGEPVDGLGGQRDGLAGEDQPGRAGQRLGLGDDVGHGFSFRRAAYRAREAAARDTASSFP
jgi:hypothetical protein